MFVRDGFSLWAFLLAPLWLLWRRLWLVLLLYVVVMAALQAGLWALGAPASVKFAVGAADRAAGRLRGGDAAALDASRGAAGSTSASWSRDDRGIRRAALLRRLGRARGTAGRRRPSARPRRRRIARQPIRRTSSACFPSRSRAGSAAHERRHRRLRLGQSALGREGVRARRARERARASRSW